VGADTRGPLSVAGRSLTGSRRAGARSAVATRCRRGCIDRCDEATHGRDVPVGAPPASHTQSKKRVETQPVRHGLTITCIPKFPGRGLRHTLRIAFTVYRRRATRRQSPTFHVRSAQLSAERTPLWRTDWLEWSLVWPGWGTSGGGRCRSSFHDGGCVMPGWWADQSSEKRWSLQTWALQRCWSGYAAFARYRCPPPPAQLRPGT
jgi:hypothetical protein